jgi:hypothetical protein
MATAVLAMGNWGFGVETTLPAQAVSLSKAVSMENVGASANPIAQTIVEAMRSATGAELALLGAAFFDESVQFPAGSLPPDALLKAVRYPEDEVVVLNLTGEQLLQAFERALELYPQKNNAFLQLTGAEVRFNPKAEPGKRIQSVFISGAKLDPKRTYRVATTAPWRAARWATSASGARSKSAPAQGALSPRWCASFSNIRVPLSKPPPGSRNKGMILAL